MGIKKGLVRLIYTIIYSKIGGQKGFFFNNNLISSYLKPQKKELPVLE